VLELVAGGLDEVEDASREFDPRVEIVSRPPNQFLNTIPVSYLPWVGAGS